MKIPSTNYQLTWHRPGEIAHHSPEKIEKPSTTISDLLPVKVRSTSERATAFRTRSQFISQAHKLTAYIAANPKIATNPKPILQPIQTLEEQASSKKANQLAAEETLKNVRLALYNQNYGSHKSLNKFNIDKREFESARISKGKCGELSSFGNITNVFHQAAIRSKNIWESTSINCSGLAYAAMDYVHTKHPNLPVSLIFLQDKHSLIALGVMNPELANLPLGAWPEHVHICDPWTNITCPAPEYPKIFLEKMAKWDSGKKLILSNNSEWINPTNKNWESCVKEPSTIHIRQRYEKGLFFDHRLLSPPVELDA
jgi:hypothetical protein